MTVIEALRIFNISDIDSISKEYIKKTYRELMRMNHPDKGGNLRLAQDINEANEVLTKVVNQMATIKPKYSTKTADKPCLLDLESYIKIFSGNIVKLKFRESEIQIDKHNINKFRLLISTQIYIDINGIRTEYNTIFARNLSDTYDYTVLVPITSIDECIDFNLTVNNKSKSISKCKSSTVIVFEFDYNIKVRVRVERMINCGN